jgi:hypothetical protein
MITIVRVIIKNTFGIRNRRKKYQTAVAWEFPPALEKTNKNANHHIGDSHFYWLSSLTKNAHKYSFFKVI